MHNRKFDSRVSGEIFIEPQLAPVMSSIKTRCAASRLDRRSKRKIVRFYKYFAPAALGILILAASILPRSAEALAADIQTLGERLRLARHSIGRVIFGQQAVIEPCL